MSQIYGIKDYCNNFILAGESEKSEELDIQKLLEMGQVYTYSKCIGQNNLSMFDILPPTLQNSNNYFMHVTAIFTLHLSHIITQVIQVSPDSDHQLAYEALSQLAAGRREFKGQTIVLGGGKVLQQK